MRLLAEIVSLENKNGAERVMKRKTIIIFMVLAILAISNVIFSQTSVNETSKRDGYRPEHLDVAFVIDKSYSMYGTKINQAATAIGNVLGQLENDDELGIASYNHEAETNFPMTLVTAPAVLQTAANSLNNITITSLTSVGAGMLEGQNILSAASLVNAPQGMLLLSDGLENFSPMAMDAMSGIPVSTDIYTIAFGSDADQNLMNTIATLTNGNYYYGSGGDLTAICEEIVTQMRGRDLVLKEAGTITQNNDMMLQYPITVDQSDQIVFSLMWEHKNSSLDFHLFDPSGNLVDNESYILPGDMDIVSGVTQKFIRIKNPVEGIWTAKLESQFIDTDYQEEAYYFHVSTLSDLHMFTDLDQDDYFAGDEIQVTSNLIEAGNPVVEALVTADIYSLDSFIETIPLYDDGLHNDVEANDGIYGNSSSPVDFEQTCTMIIKAQKSGENGFKRVKTHSTYIQGSAPVQPPCDNEFYIANDSRSEDIITPPIFNINNAPNPFNPDTYINFNMTVEGHLNVSIYNVRGQKVKTLIDRYQEPKVISERWDGTNDTGETVSSGIYYYTIKAGDYQKTRKMVLMK